MCGYTTAWLIEDTSNTTWYERKGVWTNNAWTARWFHTKQVAEDYLKTMDVNDDVEILEHMFEDSDRC